jgi:hypothetical protein
MEPISLATSITALAELAFNVCTTLNKFYGRVRGASTRASELRQEMTMMHTLISIIKSTFIQESNVLGSHATKAILELVIPLFHSMLQELEKKLEPKRIVGIQRLTWPFNEESIVIILQRIERLKGTLNLVLGIERK